MKFGGEFYDKMGKASAALWSESTLYFMNSISGKEFSVA